MKFLRSILMLSLLTGVAVAQLPSVASCQMLLSPQSVGCHMPCCKTSPVSKCDMKVQAPNDLIANLSPIPDFSVQKVIFTLAVDTFHVRHALRHQLHFLTEQLKILFFPAQIVTRGPPPDIHLLFA